MALSAETIVALKRWLRERLEPLGPLPLPSEDLIAEVTLRLLVASSSREIQSPFAYALTILRNYVRDQIREAEHARRALERLAREKAGASSGAGDCDPGEDRALVQLLLERAHLTPNQERVIRLMYERGLSVGEAARALSRNPGTVKQHHDRAIRRLAATAATLRLET